MDDRIMQELRLHGEAMATEGGQSPLVQIREKELEIRGRVMEAQKQSEQIVAEARARAAKLIEEAEREAEREASAAFEAGVAEIDADVQDMSDQQDAQTNEMIGAARARMGAAADRVLASVVP